MDFHWPTLLLQAVNFLVLLAILWRVLWRPLRRHMQARQERIEAGLAGVLREREELEAERVKATEALARAKAAESEALARAEREAEARRAELLQRAHDEAAKEWERMHTRLRGDQKRLEQDFVASLNPMLGRVLTRVLSELSSPASLHEAACQRLAEDLNARDQAELETLASGAEVELEVSTDEIPAALQAAVARLLPAGVEPRRTIRSELIGGASLRIGDQVFDGSVKAQIELALGGLS